MGCTGTEDRQHFPDRAAISALNRLNGFAILPEGIPGETASPDKGSDVRERFVNFGISDTLGVGIVKDPLLEWDVSADKLISQQFCWYIE